MSRPQFLADHDLNEHIVTGVLRQEPALKFLRVRDLGMSKSTDEEVLEHADREGPLVDGKTKSYSCRWNKDERRASGSVLGTLGQLARELLIR
ncbi:MAG TPA: hypothetical protein VKA15_12305 [Isosphaeraceae bacterium]|nr:hypothetical protein [Isosphaeraceae bacterium]